ncbi:MAG: caspase family protein [Richelia sp. RM2_1_2]|nr:caspase family protein [Richelia sp. RM2_1_2]
MSKKRALLIGINYPNTTYQLNGCINDVMLINQILTEHFGFIDPLEKQMLIDKDATTLNIIEKLYWLVSNAQSGDALYLHYSGHGLQTLAAANKNIKQININDIFYNMPVGVKLTMVFDCCYTLGFVDDYLTATVIPVDISESITLVVNSGVIISGCRKNQKSADLWLYDKFIGAATYFIAQNLKNYKYEVDYLTLTAEINQSMKKHKYKQQIELIGDSSCFSTKFLK